METQGNLNLKKRTRNICAVAKKKIKIKCKYQLSQQWQRTGRKSIYDFITDTGKFRGNLGALDEMSTIKY